MKLNIKQVDDLNELTASINTLNDNLSAVASLESDYVSSTEGQLTNMNNWADDGMLVDGVSLNGFTAKDQLKALLVNVVPCNMIDAFRNLDIVEIPISRTIVGNDITNAFRGTRITSTSRLDAPFAKTCSGTFAECTELTKAENINVPMITDSAEMFKDCTSLTDVEELDLKNVTTTVRMFENCDKLPATFPWTVDLTGITSNEMLEDMFNGVGSREVTIRLNDAFADEFVVTSLATYGKLQTVHVIRPDDTVEDYTLPPALNFTNWWPNGAMIEDTSYASAVTAEDLNVLTGYNVPACAGMFDGAVAVTSIPKLNVSLKATDLSNMFRGCAALTEIPEFNISQNVTTCAGMFQGCSSLTTVEDVDLSSVADVTGMFKNCTSLTTLRNIDLTGAEDMYEAFGGCTSLNVVDGLRVNAVSYLAEEWFYRAPLTTLTNVTVVNGTNCSFFATGPEFSSLATVTIASAPTVTTFNSAFNNCSSLRTVTIANAPSVTNWTYAFNNCAQLSSVDVTIAAGADVTNMFNGCTSLTTAPNLGSPTKINNVFNGCTSLPTTFPYTLNVSNLTSAENIYGAFDGSSVENLTVMTTSNNTEFLLALNFGVKNLTVLNSAGEVISTSDDTVIPTKFMSFTTSGQTTTITLPTYVTKMRVALVSGGKYTSPSSGSADDINLTINPSKIVDTVTGETIITSIYENPPGAENDGLSWASNRKDIYGYQPVFGAQVNTATSNTYGGGVSGGFTASSSGKFVKGYRFMGYTLVDQVIDVVGGRSYRITVGAGSATGCAQPRAGNYVSGYVLIGWGAGYVSS